MLFRLPTHPDSFIPPPAQQAPELNPWRGALIVSGIRNSDRSNSQTIRATAVETDGDNRVELWPSQLVFQVVHGRALLKDFQAWVNRHSPPLCTFMPDRLRDGNLNMVNQAAFRSLSRILFESQTIAIASWGSDDIPGAGVIILPAENSSSLLIGTIFFNGSFPSFVLGSSIPSPPIPMSPSRIPPGYATQYHQMPSHPSSSSSRHRHATTLPQVMSYPTPSLGELGSQQQRQQHQYRFLIPPSSSSTRSSYPTDNAWSETKNEENNYAPSSTHGNPHY